MRSAGLMIERSQVLREKDYFGVPSRSKIDAPSLGFPMNDSQSNISARRFSRASPRR